MVKVVFKKDFVSPTLGNIYAGKIGAYTADKAGRLVRSGLADFVKDIAVKDSAVVDEGTQENVVQTGDEEKAVVRRGRRKKEE